MPIEDYHKAVKTQQTLCKWPWPMAAKYPKLASPEIAGTIAGCVRCFTCMSGPGADYAPICPSWESKKFESYLAGGRMKLANALLRGTIEPTPKLVERFYYCTLCGGCSEACQPIIPIDVTNALLAVREQLVDLGVGPMPQHKQFAEYVKDKGNVYGEPRDKRTAWMREAHKREHAADVVYFVGCTASYRTQHVAEATLKVLNASGVRFTILGEEWCCGSPLYTTGQRQAALDAIERNIGAIENTRASQLVTSCAGCYKMFKVVYPKLTKKRLPFEVLHSTEFVNRYSSRLRLTKKVELKVTYHDPCHLGRDSGVYNPPRAVLENIPGVTLIEMERIGRMAWCCGAGGGVLSAFPTFAWQTAAARLREVTEYAGVHTVTSACPFCELNLSGVQNLPPTLQNLFYPGSKVRVLDVVELVAQALG
jgi:heterodisulfide reductase subunit D